jgi:DNA-directed RNA polymerase subunit RPC12/RpoP
VSTPTPSLVFHCSQCGGELYPDEGQVFITCPYCSSTVYLDKSRVVFHWYIAPTLDLSQARAALNRWMAGNQTVKDLDEKSQLTGQEFAYFPVWYFREKDGGKDQIRLEPAAATSVTELRTISLPAGDLRRYEDSVRAESLEPTVPLDTAQGWLTQQGSDRRLGEIAETSLVHIPIYTFKYSFKNQTFTAVVEAATGSPAKAEPTSGGLPGRVVSCACAVRPGTLYLEREQQLSAHRRGDLPVWRDPGCGSHLGYRHLGRIEGVSVIASKRPAPAVLQVYPRAKQSPPICGRLLRRADALLAATRIATFFCPPCLAESPCPKHHPSKVSAVPAVAGSSPCRRARPWSSVHTVTCARLCAATVPCAATRSLRA